MPNHTVPPRENSLLTLEARMRELEDTGDILAEATRSLRASARVFALAAARLERGRTRRHVRTAAVRDAAITLRRIA